MTGALRMLLAAIAVVVFAEAARLLAGAPPEGELVDGIGRAFLPPGADVLEAGTALGVLLLGGWLFGRIAYAMGLSKITGFLLFGILVGPGVSAAFTGGRGIISDGQRESLELVNDLAISLIALTAGGEIDLAAVRRLLGGIATTLAVQVVLVVAMVGTGMYLLLPSTGWLEPEQTSERLAIAAVIATIAVASSPAVVIAILAETGARGPMAQFSLASAVCKDLVLVVLFAIVLTIAAPVVVTAAEQQDAGELAWTLTQELGGSILAGLIAGGAIAVYVGRVGAHLAVLVVAACLAIALVSERLHLEPLLVALVAGLVIRNVWGSSTVAVFDTTERMSLPVYVVFFALAGSKVDPAKISDVWLAVVALVLLRAAALWVGAEGGARVAGLPPRVRRWTWTAFVPQAGVSLALATVVSKQFAERPGAPGVPFQVELDNLLLSAIAIHELVGPVLFKLGLGRAGETGPDPPRAEGTGPGEGDTVRRE